MESTAAVHSAPSSPALICASPSEGTVVGGPIGTTLGAVVDRALGAPVAAATAGALKPAINVPAARELCTAPRSTGSIVMLRKILLDVSELASASRSASPPAMLPDTTIVSVSASPWVAALPLVSVVGEAVVGEVATPVLSGGVEPGVGAAAPGIGALDTVCTVDGPAVGALDPDRRRRVGHSSTVVSASVGVAPLGKSPDVRRAARRASRLLASALSALLSSPQSHTSRVITAAAGAPFGALEATYNPPVMVAPLVGCAGRRTAAAADGTWVGDDDDAALEAPVGSCVGADGFTLGVAEGEAVGTNEVGELVGNADGADVAGEAVGADVEGLLVGDADGTEVEGAVLGAAEGSRVGNCVGAVLGIAVGDCDGARLGF